MAGKIQFYRKQIQFSLMAWKTGLGEHWDLRKRTEGAWEGCREQRC